ncbi:MAG: hypothetical protein JST55_04000 [Bacteroidetes bacterium]|nr:hypothetical protein [Bacteroidota bacterium]
MKDLIPNAGTDSFRYRPLSSFIFFITSFLFGLKPWLWSLAAQLNHILNFLLLILIFKRIRTFFDSKSNLYLILPLFYLFYPGNVANVAWAAGRMDLAVILFCLSSFYFSLKYIEQRNFYFLLISAILFFLATLVKENATCWFAVELLLFWVIYRIKNKPAELFKSLLKIFKSKVSILILYIICRSVLAGVTNKEILANVKIITTINAFLKSLLFTFLPVDSGTFIYSFDSSLITSIILYSIYFASLIVISILIYSRKKIFVYSFSFLSIAFITLFYYTIAGGGTYRLFALTFTSSLIFLFIIICAKEKLNFLTKISGLIIFLFFVYGFNKVSDYWIVNYKLQEESLSSLINIYDKDKENVILDYPHSLGQASCYSDIGIYLYYKANNEIGRYNNITELAGINSHVESHYIEGCSIEKKDETYILTSGYNDTFFSPEPFYTQKSSVGEKFNNQKDYLFEVMKLNSFNKPTVVKLQRINYQNKEISIIKYSNGKFEKY